LPFFPNTSYKYATDKKNKLDKAQKTFLSNEYNKNGEIEDPYIKLCFDENILTTIDFDYYAKKIFSKYWVEEDVE